MREFRYILLNQFNYLRSIEKRITCDVCLYEYQKINEYYYFIEKIYCSDIIF